MEKFLTLNIKKRKELYSFLVSLKGKFSSYNPIHVKRRNGIYEDTYSFLQRSEYWSLDEIKSYQFTQLKTVLTHAYNTTLFYKKLYDKHKVHPDDFKSLEDISKFPFLTKEMIRDNYQEIISSDFKPYQLKTSSTGGSTGIPIRLIRERIGAEARESAYIHNIWKRFGYSTGERLAVLMGAVLKSKDKNSFWIKSGSNKIILSSYNLNENTVADYIKTLEEFNPSYIQAYPSTMTLFADYITDAEKKIFPNLKAIICVSENLYSWQRTLLEKKFQCKVFSHYGHSERVVLAGECEQSASYHIQPEYGFVELLNKDGQNVREGELGEIISTGFTNFSFPLIRYKTMDYARKGQTGCSCGRNHQILECIEGRSLDYYVDIHGNLLPSTGSILIVKESGNLRKLQFIQEKAGEVTLKVVKNEKFDESEANAIINSLHTRYNSKLMFKIEYVADIPPLQNGKTRYFIQKLPVKF